jgi:hypothetical protein
VGVHHQAQGALRASCAIDATIAAEVLAMIDDMASLKQAMEQMDSEDLTVAQAGKDRAAQILKDANSSFSKLAETIDQRRLLLPPRIVTSIRRMDQPHIGGDMAFRDASFGLRKDGQSFRQIAEALELSGKPTLRIEEPVQNAAPLHEMALEHEPEPPVWLSVLDLGARVVFYPLRHPIRFAVIALIAFMLFSTLRGFVGGSGQVPGGNAGYRAGHQSADAAPWSISSLFDRLMMRPSREVAPPPTPPAPISPSLPTASLPTPTPSTSPVAPPAPSANESATAPSTVTVPPSTPRFDARSGSPSGSTAHDRSQSSRSRSLESLMPDGMPRESRIAGPCAGGIGGCYWGGRRY